MCEPSSGFKWKIKSNKEIIGRQSVLRYVIEEKKKELKVPRKKYRPYN